jgi:alkanesulfonate monooxygenase SsuD/methylene tetrahydromethanopterin reductase-like flavin-dependent oxidoreductase (luciferase family)
VRPRDEPSGARGRAGGCARHHLGGRLELGTARSSTWTELGGFGTDPDLTKKTWDEYVRIIPKMWTQDRFSFDGLSCHVPERNVCRSRCKTHTHRSGSP